MSLPRSWTLHASPLIKSWEQVRATNMHLWIHHHHKAIFLQSALKLNYNLFLVLLFLLLLPSWKLQQSVIHCNLCQIQTEKKWRLKHIIHSCRLVSRVASAFHTVNLSGWPKNRLLDYTLASAVKYSTMFYHKKQKKRLYRIMTAQKLSLSKLKYFVTFR